MLERLPDVGCMHLGAKRQKMRTSALADAAIGPGHQTNPSSEVSWGGIQTHLTAPKVRPWTSCFWASHPKTTIGATASVETAETLAQNNPSGA